MFAEFLLISLSVALLPANAQEGSLCTLPNTLQSTCTRLHLCESFQTIIRNSNGRPTPDQAMNIRRHACPTGQLVCCPDNVIVSTTTTTTAVPTTTITAAPYMIPIPYRSNLTTIKQHKNFNLINDKKCGSSVVTDRIIGGFEATLGEFPWMVLLQFRSRNDFTLSFNCGGTLITPWYVLTAGHCISRDLVGVRLGEHKISTPMDCDHENVCADPVQDIIIDKTIRHSQYDNRIKINDIALIRLKSPANISGKFVKTICLPTEPSNQIEEFQPLARDKMTITGWGKTESGKQSDVLLKAYVPFVKHDSCVQRFVADKIPIHKTYLCAGGKNKTDTCNGDSGGPIQSFGMVNNKQRSILYGVVSVGVQCTNPEAIYPGIYTNVAYYLDWILDNIS